MISNAGFDFIYTANAGFKTEDKTITASDLTAGTVLQISWFSNEATKTCYVSNIQARYYIKRGL